MGVLTLGVLAQVFLPSVGYSVAAGATNICGVGTASVGYPDVNGDGKTDLIIGMPGADHGRGAVEVVQPGHRTRVYRPGTDGIPTMPAGSQFGASVFATDVNADSCDDVLVGIPGLPVEGDSAAGGIEVLLAQPGGALGPGGLITQGANGAPGSVQGNARFGTSILARGTDSAQDPAEISVGAPGADVTDPATGRPVNGAGEVSDFALGASGTVVESSGYSDRVRTMPTPQGGAHFGTAMNEDAIGAPGADHGSKVDTGYVEIDGRGFWGHEVHDQLGSSLAPTNAPLLDADEGVGMLVGAPGHQVGTAVGAGAVYEYIFYPEGGTTTFYRRITAATPGVPGAPTARAHFGASITSIETEHQSPARSCEVTVIGSPGARVGRHPRAGTVSVLVETFNEKHTKRASLQLTPGTGHLPGSPAAGNEFGVAAAAEFLRGHDDYSSAELALGAPGYRALKDTRTGAVEIIPIGVSGLKTKHAKIDHPADNSEGASDFGASIQ